MTRLDFEIAAMIKHRRSLAPMLRRRVEPATRAAAAGHRRPAAIVFFAALPNRYDAIGLGMSG